MLQSLGPNRDERHLHFSAFGRHRQCRRSSPYVLMNGSASFGAHWTSSGLRLCTEADHSRHRGHAQGRAAVQQQGGCGLCRLHQIVLPAQADTGVQWGNRGLLDRWVEVAKVVVTLWGRRRQDEPRVESIPRRRMGQPLKLGALQVQATRVHSPPAMERRNEQMNPITQARPTAGPACSTASGTIVSASMVSTAPAAKVSVNASVVSPAPPRRP
jgi:hypothetical protein